MSDIWVWVCQSQAWRTRHKDVHELQAMHCRTRLRYMGISSATGQKIQPSITGLFSVGQHPLICTKNQHSVSANFITSIQRVADLLLLTKQAPVNCQSRTCRGGSNYSQQNQASSPMALGFFESLWVLSLVLCAVPQVRHSTSVMAF